MGAEVSTVAELAGNEKLSRLVAPEPICFNNPFWNGFMSYTVVIPRTKHDDEILSASIRAHLDKFLQNNLKSCNLAALLHVFLSRVREIVSLPSNEQSAEFLWQTERLLFVIRCICKYLIETLTEDALLKQLNSNEKPKEEPEKLLDYVLFALLEILVKVPLDRSSYSLHVEALSTLLVFVSQQMFSSRASHTSVIFTTLMSGQCKLLSASLTKYLVETYMAQTKNPSNFYDQNGSQGGSLIVDLAVGLFGALGVTVAEPTPSDQRPEAVLSQLSLTALLILTNHCTDIGPNGVANPFRKHLFAFGLEEVQVEGAGVCSFICNGHRLLQVICGDLNEAPAMLLLYMLLHNNVTFKTFVLSRANIDYLVLPILQVLYQAENRSSYHVYMALIVLLILSEDDLFSQTLQDVTLPHVSWYTERNVSDITLGSLFILVVIRTMHYNMTRARDRYLHTNCLAALANTSAHFCRMHPYAAQRIVSLCQILGKRYHRLQEQISLLEEGTEAHKELFSDLGVCEEMLRLMLEIINSCLSHQLKNNPNLVYCLLYKSEVFGHFGMDNAFMDVVKNIDIVIQFFTSKLDQATQSQQRSEAQVTQLIQEASMLWSSDRLRKFPELKFRYVEENQPEEFFVPYIWSLTFASAPIHWKTKNLILFNPSGNQAAGVLV
ncbi:dymeclin-like [Varroa jacobsoni]|uniref:Dymeclin n=1 Tax=Varroa destructor TaxID=109461 RepID=A0A7M7KTD0_VARDE|nr:dymeclin-like [Varroa destructor]XP_022708656.1 dymeclin-like [Varroa jacobsoni]